ncbi:MAG: PhoH family protein [Acidobacteria bacterium]|nr:MAG: PhoH family protein [Acidobacteriota bacterium]
MTTVAVNLTHGLQPLFGTHDENIRFLEAELGVTTHVLEDALEVTGEKTSVLRVRDILNDYETLVREGNKFSQVDIKSYLRVLSEDPEVSLLKLVAASRQRSVGQKVLAPRGLNQMRYIEAMDRCDMVFGIGPAGTGKTYLAVAQAVSQLLSKQVRRIVLTRPAVEAGERLGFLPGTIQQKVDPYLRPLYDALHDMLEPDRVERLIEKNVIEIAPLAFMRGRSLNESFIILDEAQNTTVEQMKMFITRLGFGSRAVITGDVTQIDLAVGRRSGLLDAVDVLPRVEGISFQYFNDRDVVRHDLVQRVVRAYERYNQKSLFPAKGGVGHNSQPPTSTSE